MIPYIFHVSLLLALCYLLYRLLWEKETYFQLNRWILITCLLLSFGLPLLTVPENWSLQKRVVQQEILAEINPDRPITQTTTIIKEPKGEIEMAAGNKEFTIENNTEKTPLIEEETTEIADQPFFAWTSKLNFWQIIQYIYLGGLIIFSLNFLIQLMLIIFQRQTNPTIQDGRFTIVEINQDKAPFSFGNNIFINPTKYDWDTYNQILDHEKIHSEQRHTLDILLAELAVIVQWFNPFAWLYRKAVENNLEYLTDDNMLNKGTEPESYQMNLLRVSVPQLPLNLTTNYNQSFLKKRIAMMNVKKSSASSSWKYLLLFPLLALTVITLNPIYLQAQTTKPTSEKDKKEPTKKSFWENGMPTPPSPPAPPASPASPNLPVPPSPPAPPNLPAPPAPPSPPVPPTLNEDWQGNPFGYSQNHTVTNSYISGDSWTREEVIETYSEGLNVNGSVEFEEEAELVLNSGVLKINGEIHLSLIHI